MLICLLLVTCKHGMCRKLHPSCVQSVHQTCQWQFYLFRCQDMLTALATHDVLLSCCSLSSDGLVLLFILQPAGGSRLLQKRRSGALSWWRMNGNEVEAGAGRSFCSVCCTRVCPNLCTRISVVDIYSSVNADAEHLSLRALNIRNITSFCFCFILSKYLSVHWLSMMAPL